jgi:uncharacterized protein
MELTTRARRKILSLFLTLLIAYLLALIVLRLFEPQLIFFPNYPARLEGDWHPRELPVEDVWLKASDGMKLHAWWIPNTNAKFTFLAFHGNASNIANRASVYEFLHSTPANVLALEYRGYGHSEGKPSEAGIYLDAKAAHQYLVELRKIDPKTIISFGQSLGTAVAADLGARLPVGAIVLEAPFPSASALARKIFWFLPGIRFFVHGQLNTEARLQQARAPLLVVHCTQDPVIPFEFGKAVYDRAPDPKHFLKIENVCHEEASVVSPGKYRETLDKFLATSNKQGNVSKKSSAIFRCALHPSPYIHNLNRNLSSSDCVVFSVELRPREWSGPSTPAQQFGRSSHHIYAKVFPISP